MYYINSRNREAGTDSDFTYKLDIPANSGYNRAVVMTANIPKTYYVVPSGRNTFTLREDGKSATITMKPGNYGRTTFRTNLQAKLIAASPNGATYTVEAPDPRVDPDDGKFTFTTTFGGVASFVIGEYLYEQLGFNKNTTQTLPCVSANVCKFQPEDTLFLHTDMVSDNGSNILQEFFTGPDQPFSTSKHEAKNPTFQSRPIVRQSANIYNFVLTDEDNNPIDLGGANIVFTILLYIQGSN